MLVEAGAGAARSGAILNVNFGFHCEKLPLPRGWLVLGCVGQKDKSRGTSLNRDNETLRWPTNLDQAGIVARLVEVRAMAEAAGLPEVAARFSAVESMPAGEIGANVIGALTWLQEKPEQAEILLQLSMVAMNLKNLK
jgi:hypothetical protein